MSFVLRTGAGRWQPSLPDAATGECHLHDVRILDGASGALARARGWPGASTLRDVWHLCESVMHGTINDRAFHIACSTCGLEFDEKPTWTPTPSGPHDPHVGLPLYFQRSVGGEILWAYNREHLVFLRGYVGATNRMREPNRNGSLASRLPAWMKSAKHREAIVQAADAMLEEP